MWFVISLSNPNTNLEIALQQQCENYCAKNAYCIEIPRFHTGKKSRSVKNRLFALHLIFLYTLCRSPKDYLYWVTFSNKCAFNTQYLSYSTIVYLVKMESESTNFGLKMTLKVVFYPFMGVTNFHYIKYFRKGKIFAPNYKFSHKNYLLPSWDFKK